MFRAIKDFLLFPYYWWKQKREFKKRMAELKKRDPFIYR